MAPNRWILVCMLVIGILQCVSCVSRPSTMVLQNNQFKNVVVAIHDSIAEDANIITSLKDTLSKASVYLHTATRQRAYFKEITILVPSTWSNQASYSNPTTESITLADIIITDPIRGKRSLPQARSYGGCGQQGVHVLLTKDFLTDAAAEPYHNDPAKYLIHSFAQFRWGVFQEYAEEGESEFYISFQSAYPEAIRCVYGIRGLIQRNNSNPVQPCYPNSNIDPSTGLYEKGCVWRPYPTRQRVQASIMDHQYITVLETFCDDDHANYKTEHNFEAPNKHNRLCGHRSTWDIITNTPDFNGGINQPSGLLDGQVTPTFKVVRAHARKRRAVVLLDNLLTGAKLEDVKLSIKRLHHEAGSHGIELNMQPYEGVDGIVDETEDNTKRILITDRNLTDIPGLETDMDMLLLGHEHTHNTNGGPSSVLRTGSTQGHGHLDRLRYVILGDQMDTDHPLITRREIKLHASTPITGTVGIDETLSSHIQFFFYYEQDIPYIELRSPSGVIFDTESAISQENMDLQSIMFHFEFIEVGQWHYKIYQYSREDQHVQIIVSSKSETVRNDPVIIRPSITLKEHNRCLLLNVDVTQGSHPVIGLNVSADIETPDGAVQVVMLMDTGAGADISKDDGIYSRFFCHLGVVGLHHVIYRVSGSDGQVFQKEQTFSVEKENADEPKITRHVSRRSMRGSIERHVFGGSLFLGGIQEGLQEHIGDTIAPNRVTDLKAEWSIKYRNTLVLSWTAPGDNLDHRKAKEYDLFVGYDIDDVRTFLKYTTSGTYNGRGQVTRETQEVKVSASESELLLWKPYYRSRTLAFCIRATDDVGNYGDCSNVASALPPLRK